MLRAFTALIHTDRLEYYRPLMGVCFHSRFTLCVALRDTIYPFNLSCYHINGNCFGEAICPVVHALLIIRKLMRKVGN